MNLIVNNNNNNKSNRYTLNILQPFVSGQDIILILTMFTGIDYMGKEKMTEPGKQLTDTRRYLANRKSNDFDGQISALACYWCALAVDPNLHRYDHGSADSVPFGC